MFCVSYWEVQRGVIMTDSLMISTSNQYAAYTAAAKNEQSVSELSKLVKGEKVGEPKNSSDDTSMAMDKVIISKEALERLESLNMASA